VHHDQGPYRALCEALTGPQPADALRAWHSEHPGERAWVLAFAARQGDPVPGATTEELWRLYAISRVCELLLTHLDAPLVPADEAHAFLRGLGLSPLPDLPFTPLLHEIVEVTEDGDDAPIRLDGPALWDGWMAGPLVMMRAGVRVRGGRSHLRKDIAERSTLYWAWRRGHRPVQDLSRGWGSNSQWRTKFRRDYLVDGVARYNVDATSSQRGDEDLSEAEAAELIRHRCFIRCDRPDDDLWPYDAGLVEPL